MDELFDLDVQIVPTNQNLKNHSTRGLETEIGQFCYTFGRTCGGSPSHSCWTSVYSCTGPTVGSCGVNPTRKK